MKTIILMATLLVSLSAFAGKDKAKANKWVTGPTAQAAYDNAQEFISWLEAGDFSKGELQLAFPGYIHGISACFQSNKEKKNKEKPPVINGYMKSDITSAVSFKTGETYWKVRVLMICED